MDEIKLETAHVAVFVVADPVTVTVVGVQLAPAATRFCMCAGFTIGPLFSGNPLLRRSALVIRLSSIAKPDVSCGEPCV